MTAIIIVAAGIVIGINIHTVYQPILKAEEPAASDALEVVNYLEENGYEMAYSTFENANKMTALSNGKVNVYAINSFETMDVCKWLTNVEGYPDDRIADQDGAVYIVPEARTEEFESWIASVDLGIEIENLLFIILSVSQRLLSGCS